MVSKGGKAGSQGRSEAEIKGSNQQGQLQLRDGVDNEQSVHWSQQKPLLPQDEQIQRNGGSESQETWVADQLVNEEVQTAVSKQQEGTMREGTIGYKQQGEWGKAA